MDRPHAPKFKNEPHPSKSPKIGADPESYLKSSPSWRFSRLELCDPFGWHAIDGETVHFICSKLAAFETMSWSDIVIRAKKFSHQVSTKDLFKDAKKRLEELHATSSRRQIRLTNFITNVRPTPLMLT